MSTYDRFLLYFKPGYRLDQREPFKWLCDELDRQCPQRTAQSDNLRPIPSWINQAVETICGKFSDRRGFDLTQLDEETQQEIKNEMRDAIASALQGQSL